MLSLKCLCDLLCILIEKDWKSAITNLTKVGKSAWINDVGERKVNDFKSLFLTMHGSFLDDTARTPVGNIIQETLKTVVIRFPAMIEFKFCFVLLNYNVT